MEELKNAFYEVMYKYEKSFGEDGVIANLNAWAESKKTLITLLRRHPEWNEDAKAVVIKFNEGREIERDVVDETAFAMISIADEIIDKERQESFHTAFNAAVGEYSTTLSDAALEIIRETGNIKCASGQKTSRIIGRLCRQFGVDSHERYNAVFAQLSDALNPLKIQKTAVLSVHPCDFLEMSSKTSTWKSCHNLSTGSYKTGTLSYMVDSVSMILFTVDPEIKDHFYRAARRTRQMFFFKENMLYQSRLYPEDSSEIMTQNRSIVQKIIATCLGVPNFWTLKTKRNELSEICESAEGSEQYPDYDYCGNLSILKGTAVSGKIIIGEKPICVCCGTGTAYDGQLKCGCENKVVCQDCGETVPRAHTRYIENAFHCNACLHLCASCGRIIRDTMYPAYDRKGNQIEVCLDCFNASLEPCAACSVQRICQVIGASLCPRRTIMQTA